MRGICIESHDPAVNLALEELLFTQLAPDGEGYFLLWRNAPSIIVGRHQNTAQEVHQGLVRAHNLPVVRRMTGGGAVYHDLGNVNYSFITGKSGDTKIDFGVFMHPILDALHDLGVDAEFTSRNDITVMGKKISGSAQLRRHGKILHHGTLLVNLDLDMLGAVLAANTDKYISKGIASVRSRVQNLVDVMPPQTGMAAVQEALLRRCADSVCPLPADIAAAAQALAEAKYRSWEWNYGASPPFTERRYQRFPWGAVELLLDVKRGEIQSCRIYGDYFAREDTALLEQKLYGVRAEACSMQSALADVDWDNFFAGCDPSVMELFFTQGQS